MAYTYQYSMSTSFPTGLNLTCLQYAIDIDEDITTSLLYCQGEGDVLSLIFDSQLSAPQESILNNIIDTHDPMDSCPPQQEIITADRIYATYIDGTTITGTSIYMGVSGTINIVGMEHATLSGLSGDDHTQYHTDTRGDARYYTQTQLNSGQLNTLYYTESEMNTISGNITAQLHPRSHLMTSTLDHTAGNYKVFYSTEAGAIAELALGASGTVLTSVGASAAPIFSTVSGSAGSTTADISSVTVQNNAAFYLSTSWQDVPFQTIRYQNSTSVLERDPSNTDRILIKETGSYIISYSSPVYCPAVERVDMRVRVNDLIVISGSETYLLDSATQMAATTFTTTLSGGDFITLQVLGQNTSEYMGINSTFTVIRSKGTKGVDGTPGAPGAPGADGLPGTGSTMNVLANGVTISGSPFATLNFINAGSITASGTSSGTVNINLGAAEMACVTAQTNANFFLSTSWQDVPFQNDQYQNRTDILQRDPSNTDRILIKETGAYLISCNLPVYCPAVERVDIRVRKNDNTVISGSETYLNDSATQQVANTFTATLSSGEFITVQALGQNTSEYIGIGSTFTVMRAAGPKGADGATGAKGDPGSGSNIVVKDNGVTISGSPTSTINFIGLTINASVSGTATVSNVFGNHFARGSSDGESNTTSASYQDKLNLTVSGLAAGTYRVGWYAEIRSNSTNTDVLFRVQQDNTTDLALVNIEAQDATSYFPTGGFVMVTLAASTTYSFDMDYCSETAGTTAYIRRARLEFWRVS